MYVFLTEDEDFDDMSKEVQDIEYGNWYDGPNRDGT